jgi:hypothetical protein
VLSLRLVERLRGNDKSSGILKRWIPRTRSSRHDDTRRELSEHDMDLGCESANTCVRLDLHMARDAVRSVCLLLAHEQGRSQVASLLLTSTERGTKEKMTTVTTKKRHTPRTRNLDRKAAERGKDFIHTCTLAFSFREKSQIGQEALHCTAL